MKTVRMEDRVESEVGNGGWYLATEPNDENFNSGMLVDDMDEEQTAKAAKLLKCSPELLTEINSQLRDIRDDAHRDLAQMWARLGD